MSYKRESITTDFLVRELAAELQLPLIIVKKIVQRIFLKIIKHLMYGRSVTISGFGRFRTIFSKSKKVARPIVGRPRMSKAKMSPKFCFTKNTKNIIENNMLDRAARIQKENNNEQ